MRMSSWLGAVVIASVALLPGEALALNVQKTLQKQGCLKCHAMSRKKDGPSIKEIAAKYREQEGGVAKLHEHLTSSPEIEVDGKKEKHKQFEAKSDSDLDEVVEWILSK